MIGKPIYGNGFRGCLSYLTRGRQGKNPERVEWSSTRNLGRLDAQGDAKEIGRIMRATANLSSRTKKPVLHLPISWTKEDAPKLDREKMERVADRLLKELGLENHQAAIYAHNDTGHKHIHILVNRIDPETGRAWSTSRDWQRINKVLADEERELGLDLVDHWGVDFERDLERVKERIERDDLDMDGPKPSEGELQQALKENRVPDIPFEKSQLKDLRDLIGVDFSEATGWKDLEDRLGAKGYTLMPKGQGAIITDGRQVAKLSQMGRGVRLSALEEGFGKSYREWTQERAHELIEKREKRLAELEPEKPDFDSMSTAERRAAERVWKGQMEAAKNRAERGQSTGDRVKDLDLADMEVRYWQQVQRTYRNAEKDYLNSKRRWKYHLDKEELANAWMDQRQGKLGEGFKKAYRDPAKARSVWEELILKHGQTRAGQLVRDNPLLLGRLNGRRVIDPAKVAKAYEKTGKTRFKLGEFRNTRFFNNSDTRKEAIKEARKLTRDWERFSKSQDVLFHIQSKIDKARRDVDRTRNALEGLRSRGLKPKSLEDTLKSLYKRRAYTLTRVTRKAILASDLTDERKEQLERTRNRYEERKRERSKKRERGGAFGLDLDLFDDD